MVKWATRVEGTVTTTVSMLRFLWWCIMMISITKLWMKTDVMIGMVIGITMVYVGVMAQLGDWSMVVVIAVVYVAMMIAEF